MFWKRHEEAVFSTVNPFVFLLEGILFGGESY